MNEYKWYDGDMEKPSYEYKTEDITPKKKKQPPIVTAAIIIAAALLLITIVLAIFWITGFSNKSSHHPSQSSGDNIIVSQLSIDTEKASTALNSVVNIENAGSFGGFFGHSLSLGEGMGAVIHKDGYILTSLYVVESVGTISVKLHDGTEYNAEVFETDYDTNTAILKIPATDLTPIAIGDSSAVKLGDAVSVIGTPINEVLSNPITGGTICAIEKNIELQNGHKVNIMQVDASTISDSVGGLVLNEKGELIGIATAMIANQSSEIGLVTPINDLSILLSSLSFEGGTTTATVTIGITGTDAPYGVIIDRIGEGTPAEKSGLKTGDLIVKVNNQAITSSDDINKIKNQSQIGDTLVFTIYRDGEMKDIEIVLE